MGKTKSRTEHITRNVFITLVTQSVLLLLAFVNRTIFIYLLNENYLGIDGLFSSILTIFSLAELGIGNAIIFSLYKPIANGDKYGAQQYLTLFKKAYNWIIIIILAIGASLLPFLPNIVNTTNCEVDINLYVIYILFLLNTTSSYFLAHKQAVLVVNQEQSTVSLNQTYVKIGVYVVEAVVLLILHSYYAFLIIRVLGNYISAFIIGKTAEKKYPELCKPNDKKLPIEEVRRIKSDVYALSIRRIGNVISSSASNILINKYISLAMVGIYSNYMLIIQSIQVITTQMMAAMTASIGNFVATETKLNAENAFRLYTYITYLLYGFCSICFILLVNRFIFLLWGEQYLLSTTTLYLIVFNFFLASFQTAINTFRDTTGLFVQGKYRSIFSALCSVILSIILVSPLGITGIIMGPILSRILISAWYDPYILYRYLFKISSASYFIRLVRYILIVFGIAFILDYITTPISNDIIGFLIVILISILSITLLIIVLMKTQESVELFKRIKDFIKNKLS